jgi:pimeloyl-ACP methyl ester carboxylesterase
MSAYNEFVAAHLGRDLDLGGLRYHYLDEGEGEPVVMLHGNPTRSFLYRTLVEALRPSYRTIVPDHIGCGRSDKPDDARYAYTLERRVADLEALLDQLRLDAGLTLVLHDWGGMIGMTYAARHPERISRLVILGRLPCGIRPRGAAPAHTLDVPATRPRE